jgi:hypothetical protein
LIQVLYENEQDQNFRGLYGEFSPIGAEGYGWPVTLGLTPTVIEIMPFQGNRAKIKKTLHLQSRRDGIPITVGVSPRIRMTATIPPRQGLTASNRIESIIIVCPPIPKG